MDPKYFDIKKSLQERMTNTTSASAEVNFKVRIWLKT